jgi:ankyrin repeat protein
MYYGFINEIRIILRVEWILDCIDLEGTLISAAEAGQIGVMAALVERGTDTELLHEKKGVVSELIVEAIFGLPNDESLHQLLDTGWPFDLERVFTETLELMASAWKSFDSMAVLIILVERRLDLNAGLFMSEDQAMRTPLRLIIEWGTPEMVEYLIDAGARVNSMASEGHFTALGEAVREMLPVKVELLISMDADVHAFANGQGTTLLELAVSEDICQFQDPEDVLIVFELLLESGADINGPPHRAESVN